jgi:hypothetical protein
MSKTPFRMPQRTEPAAAQLDNWVAGGGEGKPAVKPAKPTGKMARLTIDLPQELHGKFKSTCALKGTRMIDEVRQFIEAWTQKNS